MRQVKNRLKSTLKSTCLLQLLQDCRLGAAN